MISFIAGFFAWIGIACLTGNNVAGFFLGGAVGCFAYILEESLEEISERIRRIR